MKLTLLIIISFIPTLLSAQENRLKFEYSNYSGAYLGMGKPDTIPQKFAPGFISIEDQYDQCLVFSPDGDHLVYTWADSSWSKSGMMYTRRIGDKWLKPALLKYKGSDQVIFNPIFSDDSKKIMFSKVSSKWPNTDIFYISLTDSGYSDVARRKDIPINTRGLDFDFCTDKNDVIYFTGKRDDFVGGTFDLYKCQKKNGRYITTNLEILNSKLDEASPYVSPDGSYLVYDKMVNNKNLVYNDSTARIIQIELFVSFRDEDNEWTKPINLGPPVNSKQHRTYRPFISPDGNFLFYTKAEDGGKGADVYWVNTEVIEKLRPKP